MQDLRERRFAIQAIFGLVVVVLVVRLFYLQVVSDDYSAKADKNVIKRVVLQPQRGVIYDRNGRIYVTNSPIFNLQIVPRELSIPDTFRLARLLHMERDLLVKKINAAYQYNRNKPSPLASQVNAEIYAPLQEHLWATRGIYTEVGNSRNYLYPVGANFLGYISEVDKRDIDKSAGYYQQGDQIGRSGLERQYEEVLRGRKGVKMTLVDVHGREVGPFADGKFDTIPQKGEDIQITIDAELQLFGEALMANKLGSIVAIEPSTGEILAFISAPHYDPNQLTGMEYGANFLSLVRDTLKPLYNRPLQAMYPPGSIFKLTNAITALSAGTINEHSSYGCAGGFLRNGGRPKCHRHPSPLNLFGAIQHSCNAYFAGSFVDMLHSSRFESFTDAYNFWYESMSRFGIGHRTGVDIPNEKPGSLPTENYFNRIYGKNRWFGMTIVSMAIGQGELLMTPLQMANVTAAIANRGFYVQPHFYRKLTSGADRRMAHFDTVRTGFDPRFYGVTIDAMEKVVEAGTGVTARIPGIAVCGKTGTAENPHGEDHSVFIAFAPKDNPKIAIACIVENAGWGGTWAAPISSLMIEKYLTGRIADRNRLLYILDGDFVHSKRLIASGGVKPDRRLEAIRAAALASVVNPGDNEFARRAAAEAARKEAAEAALRGEKPAKPAPALTPASATPPPPKPLPPQPSTDQPSLNLPERKDDADAGPGNGQD